MYEQDSRVYISKVEEKHTWSTNYSRDTENIRIKEGELIKSLYREIHWIYSEWKERKIIFLWREQPTPHLKSPPKSHMPEAGYTWTFS